MYKLIALVTAAVLAVGCVVNPFPRVTPRTSDSVLRIEGLKTMVTFLGIPMQAKYVCTGFQIGENRVLTAAHCLAEEMAADNKAVTILKADEYFDLALLEVVSDKPALKLRDEPVSPSEKLWGMGYAFGWTRLTILEERAYLVDWSPSPDLAPGVFVQGGYIGGMSGGPVVDQYGRVVGMVQRGGDGVGYGVGVLTIRTFLLGTD